jgi:hypothetical protein
VRLARLKLAAALGALAACSAGSSPNDPTCNNGGTLTVRVTNAMDDSLVCDATVTATAGKGSPQPLSPVGPATDCSYFTKVQPGPYEVSASKATYQSANLTLTVQALGCSVDSPTVSLSIAPTSATP